jgi:hypothetical protein
MFDLSWPSEAGQENDTSKTSPAKRRRSDALKLSPEETKAVRVAVRKLKRAFGSFACLAVQTGIPSGTLRRIANPNGIPPTGTFAIRLAAVAKVPVEVLLGGKVVVTTPIIGRAA